MGAAASASITSRAASGLASMAFIHVSTGDLISGTQGESARNIAMAFEAALDDLPCLLFFDEFDAVAQRRDASRARSRGGWSTSC